MIPAIKAEFRKLLTVRSTYILMLAFLLLSAFFSFYVQGYKESGSSLNAGSSGGHVPASLFAASSITQIANVISVACALIGLLLLAHEYRYNTILYTLTSVNRRSRVLTAKITAIFCLVFVYSLLASAISLALVWAGSAAAGNSLPPQDINFLTFFAKSIFFCEAFALSGLLFIALIRNQVGAIAALLILPNTVEGLLSLLLKDNSVYMPFMALQKVVDSPGSGGSSPLGDLSAPRGALVFLCYLVVAWVVTWILFLRRDAS